MRISGPDFVAAISNSGAMGMMSSVMFPAEAEFREAIRRAKSLTSKPFGINLSFLPALNIIDNEMYVRVILEEDCVTVVETSGYRPPRELLARLQAGGVKTIHKCVSVRHALSAQEMGVDAVTVFGTEGGGHIGELGLTSMTLVPAACDALDIPVLAAGGIVDGRGFLAARSLGAEGVVMGTRMLLTEECPIHYRLKESLLAATEMDTITVLHSLNNAIRTWRNSAALKTAELEAGQSDVGEILSMVAGEKAQRMITLGDVDAGVIACGEGIGIVRQVRPVAEVIRDIVHEAEAIRQRLAG